MGEEKLRLMDAGTLHVVKKSGLLGKDSTVVVSLPGTYVIKKFKYYKYNVLVLCV